MADTIERPPTRYRPGGPFTCWKRPKTFDPTAQWGERIGDPCGTTIVMHGYFWCAQVCPKCLANYYVSPRALMDGGTQDIIVASFGGYYPPDVAAKVRATIERNGGQYVPEF